MMMAASNSELECTKSSAGSSWTFLDRFFPFWRDPGLRSFFVHYNADTDEEVERKRTVCLNNIRAGNDVARYQRKHKVLTVHRREKKRRRRQRREDMMGWAKLIALVLTIIGTVATAIWWPQFSSAVVKLWGQLIAWS